MRIASLRSAVAPPPATITAAAVAAKWATLGNVAPPEPALGDWKRRRGREIAARSGAIETVPAGGRSQHPPGARVGVQPHDAAIRRHPFEVIMLAAVGPGSGAVGVI